MAVTWPWCGLRFYYLIGQWCGSNSFLWLDVQVPSSSGVTWLWCGSNYFLWLAVQVPSSSGVTWLWCGSNSHLWLAVQVPSCSGVTWLWCGSGSALLLWTHWTRTLDTTSPSSPLLRWVRPNIIAHTIINGENGKFFIRNSSQNAHSNCEKNQQIFK
jgi:hypothetical protein